MGKYAGRLCIILVACCMLTAVIPAQDADARAGGGRSFGSRGSRSYSPGRSYSQPAPRRDVAPSPGQNFGRSPGLNPSGGFLRNIAGGMLGGFLGGMLFRTLGFGGGYGMGGTGIGLFEIVLIGGICYLIYRMLKRKREEQAYNQNFREAAYHRPEYDQPHFQAEPEADDVHTGLAHIRQMDHSFDEARFKDAVMDIFFRIQSAWMNRSLSQVADLLTAEMLRNLQDDVDRLLREKRMNKLENIAVRNVEITDAWQESGDDFITALIYANLLDYTVDDTNGSIVAGSNLEPVKFEEYWTFTRPIGGESWRLSAIDQK